jgi:multidrug efflux pump subunit AcrA (membrane-fusion protein)
MASSFRSLASHPEFPRNVNEGSGCEVTPEWKHGFVDRVRIVAQAAGPIVNLPIEDNQAVQAGDLLFEIDPRPFRIAVDKAKADLDKTGQNLRRIACMAAIYPR